jgi:hypothetical protein
MIRRNVVSLVAVCAALAVGVALGGGPLSDLGHADSEPSHATSTAPTDDRQQAALDRSFLAAAGPALTAGRLSGQRVAVMALPDASEATLSALTGQVKAAGGTVSSLVRIQPAAVDPARKTYADTLAKQLAAQLRGDGVDASLPTYQRLGQVIGFSYASATSATALDADQTTAAQTLVTAKLVRTTGGTTPATLVLVVLGAGGHRVEPSVLAPLVNGIGGATRRVVAVGDTASAEGGDLAVLRREQWGPWFASLDGVESSAGPVAATLALVRQIGRAGGTFGASGFGGLVPLH